MSTRMLGVLGLVLSTAATAWAGPVTLQAPVLIERPGVIAVDPKNVTTVQFCDPIMWSAFKAAWLHAAVAAQDKRVLLLDASASSGEASMHVWVEGESRPLQFLIRVSATTLANHLYFVGCARPQSPTGAGSPRTIASAPDLSARPATPQGGGEGVSPKGQTDTSAFASLSGIKRWDEFVAGLSSRQRSLLDAFVARPSADAYAAFTASLTPDQAATWARLVPPSHLGSPETLASRTGSGKQDPPSGYQALPAWAVLQMNATATLAGLVVSYKLTNMGKATLVLDPGRLQVMGADLTPISKFGLSRQSTSGVEGRVPPGRAESGVICIPGMPAGDVLVRWTVIEIETGTVYTINQRFKGSVQEKHWQRYEGSGS